MVPSTLFAIVSALSSLAVVNGAVVQRDGTFTFLTPQPTSLGQGGGSATSSASTTSAQSSASGSGATVPTTTNVTAPQSASLTASGTGTTSRTVIPVTTSLNASTTPVVSTQATGSATLVPPPVTQTTSGSVTVVPPSITRTSTSPTATGTTGTANCNGIQQWQAAFAYTAGNQVIFNNQLFTASQWTYNNAPPTHPDQWSAGGFCAQPINNQANCNGIPAWQSSATYVAGNKVTFNGHLWSAVQWTTSNPPGDTSGSWKDLGACA